MYNMNSRPHQINLSKPANHSNSSDSGKQVILSISSLNVKKFKSNYSYAQTLANQSHVLYLCQTWLSESDQVLLNEKCNQNNSKIVLSKSDMADNYSTGRPFGSQAWIIQNNLKLIEHNFLSRHLSNVHIKYNNCEFIMVRIYMPFDNLKKRLQCLNDYEMTLSVIHTLTEKARIMHIPILIAGDFNADLQRMNRFDKTYFYIRKKKTQKHCFDISNVKIFTS